MELQAALFDGRTLLLVAEHAYLVSPATHLEGDVLHGWGVTARVKGGEDDVSHDRHLPRQPRPA